MATVTDIRTARKPIQHYAHLGDVEGIARLVPGGYVFTADATGARRLVAYTDVELVLHGLVDDEPADPRPLWQQIADPGYYEGSCRRGTLVQGRQ
jgi:hypothetical protein